MAKPRLEGGIFERPAPDGPSWAIRQASSQSRHRPSCFKAD